MKPTSMITYSCWLVWNPFVKNMFQWCCKYTCKVFKTLKQWNFLLGNQNNFILWSFVWGLWSMNSKTLGPTKLGFNNSHIQWSLDSTFYFYNTHLKQSLDSTTLVFNNLEFNNLVFNNPWVQQYWIWQSVDSTSMHSTFLGFNRLGCNDYWI